MKDMGILMEYLERACDSHDEEKSEAIQRIIDVVEAARGLAIAMPSESFYQETMSELVKVVSALR